MIETGFEHKEAWFFSNANSSENSAIHIIRIGHNIARRGYTRGPHVQGETNVIFIMQGSLNLSFNDTTVQLHAGDMFCLLKENRYYYEISPSELPLIKIWIAFKGTQIEWLLEQLNLTVQLPYMREAIGLNARSLLQMILKTMKENKDPDQLLLIGLFYQLLSTIKPEERSLLANYSPYWVDHAKNYMDTHYNEPITLNDVCEHVSVSRGHFSEVFLQRYGITPSNYMKELRMERALHLVKRTSFTITEIAHSIGYHNLFSFSRAFRKHYGYSPNMVRSKTLESSI